MGSNLFETHPDEQCAIGPPFAFGPVIHAKDARRRHLQWRQLPHAPASARRRPSHHAPPPLHHTHSLLHVQRTLGNQAVVRLIAQTTNSQKPDQGAAQSTNHSDRSVRDLAIQPSRSIHTPVVGTAVCDHHPTGQAAAVVADPPNCTPQANDCGAGAKKSLGYLPQRWRCRSVHPFGSICCAGLPMCATVARHQRRSGPRHRPDASGKSMFRCCLARATTLRLGSDVPDDEGSRG